MRYQFRDRREAGQRLAAHLSTYANHRDVLILALPRGGVPVGYEVARALHAPLDVLIVRKLGLPGQDELAMGAIAAGGVRVLNEDVVSSLDVPEEVIAAVAARELQELTRREHVYRGDRQAAELRGRTVILVDDGLATGTTMRAAVVVVRQQAPARLVVAVPVIALENCAVIRSCVDELVWEIAPDPLLAVGSWYEDFTPTSDAEVRDLLARAAGALASERAETLALCDADAAAAQHPR
jgi:predicted phosphoribosyltransferase